MQNATHIAVNNNSSEMELCRKVGGSYFDDEGRGFKAEAWRFILIPNVDNGDEQLAGFSNFPLYKLADGWYFFDEIYSTRDGAGPHKTQHDAAFALGKYCASLNRPKPKPVDWLTPMELASMNVYCAAENYRQAIASRTNTAKAQYDLNGACINLYTVLESRFSFINPFDNNISGVLIDPLLIFEKRDNDRWYLKNPTPDNADVSWSTLSGAINSWFFDIDELPDVGAAEYTAMMKNMERRNDD